MISIIFLKQILLLMQNKFNCLIIDDEALARQLIQAHLKKIGEFENIYSCSSTIEAEQYLNKCKIDLIFLDIQLQQYSGIDFLKSLKNPPKVIFATAYAEFALEGYELNVVDYLLKPITFERFNKATKKAIEILNIENDNSEPSQTSFIDHSIIIKSSHQHIKILLSDILFIEGLHKYIKIVTLKANYTTLIGITAIEKELPQQLFYRCHRSFIINLSKVEFLNGNLAIIKQYNVPISKLNKHEMLTKMGKQIG